jgi:hypothetical protein
VTEDSLPTEQCYAHVGPFITYDPREQSHREAVREMCRQTSLSYRRCMYWLGHAGYSVDRAIALARQDHSLYHPNPT